MKLSLEQINKLKKDILNILDKASKAESYLRVQVIDPLGISLPLQMTVKDLITAIEESKDPELIKLAEVLFDAQDRAMFADPTYQNIRKELAEHKLKLYSTTGGALPPVYIEFPSIEEIDADIEKEISIQKEKNKDTYDDLMNLKNKLNV